MQTFRGTLLLLALFGSPHLANARPTCVGELKHCSELTACHLTSPLKASWLHAASASDCTTDGAKVRRAIGVPKPNNPFRPSTPTPGGSSVSNPWKDSSPNSQSSNPFRDPSPGNSYPGTPSTTGTLGHHGESWEELSGNPAIRFVNAGVESQRLKGEQVLRDFKSGEGADRGDTRSLEEAGYQGQGESQTAPFLGEGGDYLAEFHLDGRAADWTHDFIQLSSAQRGSGLPIVETYESPAQKAIIVKNSWNRQADPEGALRWTAMAMSNWRNAARDSKRDLRYVVWDDVQSVDTVSSTGVTLNTRQAIIQAFVRMNKPRDQTLVLTLDRSSTDVNEVAAFELMAAQTHVARVYQLLKDYRSELGNLDIAKLHLQTWSKDPNAPKFIVVVELGPRAA